MCWVCFRDETQLRRDSTCTVTGLPPRVSLSGPQPASSPQAHRPLWSVCGVCVCCRSGVPRVCRGRMKTSMLVIATSHEQGVSACPCQRMPALCARAGAVEEQEAGALAPASPAGHTRADRYLCSLVFWDLECCGLFQNKRSAYCYSFPYPLLL